MGAWKYLVSGTHGYMYKGLVVSTDDNVIRME